MSLQSLSASGAPNDLYPRAQCAHGGKLLDGKPSIATPFNAHPASD
jgi:hypothetical protein